MYKIIIKIYKIIIKIYKINSVIFNRASCDFSSSIITAVADSDVKGIQKIVCYNAKATTATSTSTTKISTKWTSSANKVIQLTDAADLIANVASSKYKTGTTLANSDVTLVKTMPNIHQFMVIYTITVKPSKNLTTGSTIEFFFPKSYLSRLNTQLPNNEMKSFYNI
jgi:hypothetical protein